MRPFVPNLVVALALAVWWAVAAHSGTLLEKNHSYAGD